MSKFQPPMLNDDVCRAATDKQTHKHTHKHTYRVKTEETFFYGQIFYFLFFFLYLFESKKTVSNKEMFTFICNSLHGSPLILYIVVCKGLSHTSLVSKLNERRSQTSILITCHTHILDLSNLSEESKKHFSCHLENNAILIIEYK